ncbi:hypothetical protein BKA70DRAFT_1179581 [Coprinopsis sp. MPI-PUGE-AT-0042]|nr:hypothetical protein BKA70DRAFT_1179581 [Coprinopsis sp. MPI-PUGE-AT-0042]
MSSTSTAGPAQGPPRLPQDPSPEDGTPGDYKKRFAGRQVTSQFVDPCAAASKASMDCLDKNNYDRDKCLDYFQAYRDCKNAWIQKRKEDRRTGKA